MQSLKLCILYYIPQNVQYLHSPAYSNLFLAHRFILILSSSQVVCKRSFSKLKYILNRLRNSLSMSSLQAFVLMTCEKDLLVIIDDQWRMQRANQAMAP